MDKKSHIIRSRIITAVAITVILVAVLFSSLRVAILYIADFTDEIEQLINQHSGLVVEIGKIDTDIQWLTPRLKLLDVSLLETKGHPPMLQLQEINLSLDWISSIENLRPTLGDVSLLGLDLALERDSNGQLLVQGIPLSAQVSGESATVSAGKALPVEIQDFLASTSLYVQQSRIWWKDARNSNRQIKLENVNLSVINRGHRHQLAIDMELPSHYGQAMTLMVDVEGPLYKPQLWRGRIYAELKQIQLHNWFRDYLDQLAFTGKGLVNARVWLDWDNSEFRQVDVELDGQQLSFSFPERNIRNWQMDRVSGVLRWMEGDHGWNIEGRDFKVARHSQDWLTPTAFSVAMDNLDKTLQLRADFLRLESLAYLTELMNKMDSENDLDWIRIIETHQPRGDLYQVNWHLPLLQPMHSQLSFRFKDLGFSSEQYPSVQGLDGELQYKHNNVQLSLDSRDTVIDFRDLFRNTIALNTIKGDVFLSRDPSTWHIRSPYLQADSPHLETVSRLHVKIPDDEPVFADLVTRFNNGDIAHKGLYLPTGMMNQKTVAWLDRALVSGRIADGGLLLYGSLADYPYLKNQGMFEVLFDAENAVLDYQSNWPALSHINSTIRFHKNAMNVLAEGRIYGARLTNTQVDIENLSTAHLSVDSKIRSPLPDLLRYIDNSPLLDMVGSYVSGMKTEGTCGLILNLQIPLVEKKPVRFNSRLSFQGNDILLPREGYQFNAVRGNLIINDKEVRADNLVASLDGYPLKASVATVKNKTGKMTRVSAAGHLPVTSLLAPVPFLKPYIRGESDWQIKVDIPNKNDVSDLQVHVESRLHGISTDLPLPFKKTDDVQAPFNLDLSLSKSGALQLDVELKDHYSLTSTRKDNLWRVYMDSPILKGMARFNQDFSIDYPMTLDIEMMDLAAYMSQSDEDKKENLSLKVDPDYLPGIQLQARKVIWKDLQVNDASLETERSERGMEINHFEMHGPALSIIGKGSWHSNWLHKHVTSLEMNITSNNFGKFLEEIDLTKGVKNASGQARINWQWYAEPHKFDWRILQGDMSVDFENGHLLDINPGAGRVLGLLNFETLLSLDFGNQVSEGFAFDSIEGSFNFANGNAYTSNFSIDSKVAEISMTGRIGLSTEDYDQIVIVVPGVGSTLTVLGAVAGGPTLAATILFVQKILGINRMAKYEYSIRGSWEKPEVKLLSAPEDNGEEAAPTNEPTGAEVNENN